jgi:N-acetyl-gamma-glutamyl-phosphate reductase
VIDLSADFRLKDPHAYSAWYKAEHESPQLLPQAVYGLPELHSESIREARLVANPGCYPTSAILALAPLLHNAEGSSIDPGSLIVDSLSGVSGAGRSKFGPATHFAEVNESVSPYAVGGIHRHTPEIEQALTQIAARPISITFTPHLVPITRGILTTAYADVAERHEDFHALYRNYYKDKPFVVVLEPGEFPATKHVYGTNNCHIGLTVDEHTNRIIVVSAIDNLIKGMAGQAIQNMNLMFGVDETAGLPASAVWP